MTPEEAEKVADSLIVRRQFRQAALLLSEVIKARPNSASALVKRAAILAESGLHTPAIADMTAAIALEPENARFRNTRGYFQLSAKNLPEALQDFSDAIGLDLNFAQPHNNRGLLRLASKDYATAIKDFDEALKIDPKYLDAHNNKGFALLQLEQYDAAIAAFSQAIELEPNYINAWNNRAQARLKAQQPEAAIADFTQALELQPQNPTYLLGRAEAFTQAGRMQEAAADRDRITWLQKLSALTQQAAKNPDNAAHFVTRGRHLLQGAMAEEALNDFNRALQLSPDNLDARCGRAAAMYSQEKFREAIEECNVAVANGPHPTALSIRGDAFFRLGDLDRAIADYQAAKRIDAQVASAYLARADKFDAAGDAARAAADRRRAEAIDASLNPIQQASAEVETPAK
jgi:tetratricopeptide (TPR) repeat protein